MKWHQKYFGLTLTNFLEVISEEKWFWVVKRLSGNDTGANGNNQSGVYLPGWFFEEVFPEICTTGSYNPRERFEGYLPQEDILTRDTNAIYYNSRFFPERNLKKKYNEFRLTRWGGKSHPLQNHDSTGALIVIAGRALEGATKAVLVWVCSNAEQEATVESWLGTEVIPPEIYGRDRTEINIRRGILTQAERLIIPTWLRAFPTGKEIFDRVIEAIPKDTWTGSLDELLIRRRELEFAIFQAVETAHVLPLIGNGFNRVDAFLDLALNVANRRKSRAGKSLELHLAEIFTGRVRFEVQKKTEGNKKPDFIFPSQKAYNSSRLFPDPNLHMLAAKTCCKDRWRQILSEADKIWPKHLFTLQEGVSKNQLDEMINSRVALVVPEANITSFPREYRAGLLTLERFVNFIRTEQGDMAAP